MQPKTSNLLYCKLIKIANSNSYLFYGQTTIHVDTILYFIILLLGKRFGTLS